MAARALLIEVRLLDGRFHGAGDWPPSPFRLFQALVAGAYGSQWVSEPAEAKDRAFRWLERLPPPVIAAPAKVDLRSVTYFVPNNDLDAVGGDLRRVGEIRTGKSVRPVLLSPADAPIVYAWRFEEGEDEARRVGLYAERLHTLGRGIDAAFASAAVVGWDEAEERLGTVGRIARPGDPGDRSNPTCPTSGSLDSLRRRHAAMATRLAREGKGRSAATLFRQPPKALSRTVRYDRPPALLLFELRRTGAAIEVSAEGRREGSTAFEPIPQECATDVAEAVRSLAENRLKSELGDGAGEIERLIAGRGALAGDIGRRVRFIPLPSIGFVHASPSIRRVLVEVPVESPFTGAQLAWALSGQVLGVPLTTRAGEAPRVVEALLVEAADRSMLDHYGVGTSARRWRSVTAVALPALPAGGRTGARHRISGNERRGSDEAAASRIALALKQAGMPAATDIRLQAEPFRLRGLPARAFRERAGRFDARLSHVDVTFAKPVTGPLLIGDGRFLGLGLMAPVRTRTGVMAFAITSGLEPGSNAVALTGALRRAMLARVQRVLGDRAVLPRYFTGHEPDGAPARSGRHEHLAIAYDEPRSRLLVIAPDLLEHRREKEGGAAQREDRNWSRLEEALADLQELRAGRAGRLVLERLSFDEDSDPLFAPAVQWQSVTPYRVTRHLRAGTAAAALVADIRQECGRLRLPMPDVETLHAAGVDDVGLTGSARLHFAVAVPGPLLIGRDRHFGGGLFAGV